MNLQEIKKAIAEGKKVCAKYSNYEVRAGKNGELKIVCTTNNHAIGLEIRGNESDFYILPQAGDLVKFENPPAPYTSGGELYDEGAKRFRIISICGSSAKVEDLNARAPYNVSDVRLDSLIHA